MVLLAGLLATAAASFPSCNVSQINVTHGACYANCYGCSAGNESLQSMWVNAGCGGYFNCDGYVTRCISPNHRTRVVCPCGPLPPPRPAGTFYVDLKAAPGGDGSQARPFQTIQDCVNIAAYTTPPLSSSTCSVKAGVYRETVDIPPAGVVHIIGEGTGKTILDGTQAIVAKFSKYENNPQIWVATLSDADPQAIEQLFVRRGGIDGVLDETNYLTEARWPNAANVSAQLSAKTLARMGPGSGALNGTAVVVDPNLSNSNPSVDFRGARIFFRVGSGESSFTSHVYSYARTYRGGQLTFTEPTCDLPQSQYDKTGEYYVAGVLGALDIPGEWYYDSKGRKLYIWPLDGADPTGTLYLKVKDYCMRAGYGTPVNLYAAQISQLSFSACTLYMQCNSCQISDIDLMYPTYSPWVTWRMPGSGYMPPVTFLGGDNNTVTRTYLRYTNNWGWYISGSNLLFEDNYIGDTNWYGSLDTLSLRIGFSPHNPCTGGWQPPLTNQGRNAEDLKELLPAKTPSLKVPQGTGNIIRRTTIRGAGSNSIATSQLENEVSLCHLSYAGLIGGDVASLHADNTHVDCNKNNCRKLWHHNWVHNCREKCVRCDDNSRNCTIYDNVIFNCGMPASNGAPAGLLIKGNNHTVGHNTLFNATGQGGFTPETKGGGQNNALNVWDNYFSNYRPRGPPEVFAYNVSNVVNSTLWQSCLVDAANYKFQPKASCAELVGKAVQHDGLDTVNSDIGAYAHTGAMTSMVYGDDYNTTDWRPGCTFHPDCFARDDPWAEWPPPSIGGH